MYNIIEHYKLFKKCGLRLFIPNTNGMNDELKTIGIDVHSTYFNNKKLVSIQGISTKIILISVICIILGIIAALPDIIAMIKNATTECITPLLFTGTAMYIFGFILMSIGMMIGYIAKFDTTSSYEKFTYIVCEIYNRIYGKILWLNSEKEFEDNSFKRFVEHPWDMYLQLRSIGVDCCKQLGVDESKILHIIRKTNRENRCTMTLLILSAITLATSISVIWVNPLIFGIAILVSMGVLICMIALRLTVSKRQCKIYGFDINQIKENIGYQYRQKYGCTIGHSEYVSE